MAGIFISYRRDDSDVAAGRLADDLSEIFGPDAIFRDLEKLEPGEDYEKALDRALDSCSVLVAMIGPRWLTIADKTGRRRLDHPGDWVRAEISRALTRGIRVIPVLVSKTVMPGEAEIPGDLKPLLKRQAFDLDDRHWKQDLQLLAQAVGKIPEIAMSSSKPERIPPVTGNVTFVGTMRFFSPQFAARLGVFRKNWVVVAALGITLICWLFFNWTWPDFPLDFGESVALFLIILLVVLLFSKVLDFISYHWARQRS
jgi:TIR domain